MKATIRLAKPEDVEATISLTMTLLQWKELRTSIAEDKLYEPGGKLREAIDDLVRQATRVFFPVEVEPS